MGELLVLVAARRIRPGGGVRTPSSEPSSARRGGSGAFLLAFSPAGEVDAPAGAAERSKASRKISETPEWTSGRAAKSSSLEEYSSPSAAELGCRSYGADLTFRRALRRGPRSERSEAEDPAGLAGADPAGLAGDPAGLAGNPAGLVGDPAGMMGEGL